MIRRIYYLLKTVRNRKHGNSTKDKRKMKSLNNDETKGNT